MRRAALAFLAACLPGYAAAADSSSDAAAQQLESALRGLSSFRAEFRQVVTNAEGEETETAAGTVSLARPGKFRWDYREPEQLIVSDGVTVWLYDADLAQVTIRPAAETLIGTPALLLSGRSDISAEFDVAGGGDEDGLAWIVLTPKSAESDFRELAVGISDGQIRRMRLVDRVGQTTRLEFDNIERNSRFAEGTFSFTPPPGVDVVGTAPAGKP